MLVVTHQLEVVKNICDKMSIMENGKIVAGGRVGDVFASEPEALLRLTGRPAIPVPSGQVCFKTTLNAHQMKLPVLSELAMPLQSGCNLLYAATDVCGDERIGHFYIAVDESVSEETAVWLRGKSVAFSRFRGN
jgi:D-methionine transport system ATP-binding protein